MSVPKVVRDGKVAVIVSPGYGAGWSTWADELEHGAAVFAPDVVEWIEAGKPDIILDDAFGKYGYVGGLDQAEIKWVPVGTQFIIEEYDGSERLTILGPQTGYIA